VEAGLDKSNRPGFITLEMEREEERERERWRETFKTHLVNARPWNEDCCCGMFPDLFF
jgi:hypothetical protein